MTSNKKSIRELFEECKRVHTQFVAAELTAGEFRDEVLAKAYSVLWFTETREEQNELRSLIRTEGIPVRQDSHLFTALTRWLSGKKSRDRASVWSGALRYALTKKVQPEDVNAFIKGNGGIEKCAKRFHDSAEGEAGRKLGRFLRRPSGSTYHRDPVTHKDRQTLTDDFKTVIAPALRKSLLRMGFYQLRYGFEIKARFLESERELKLLKISYESLKQKINKGNLKRRLKSMRKREKGKAG